MKNTLFLLLLALVSAPHLYSAQAQDVCIQVIQPAVSPDGVCQEYATPCDVPETWKSVPSCDLIDTAAEANKPTLEQKQHARLAKMRAYWAAKKAAMNANTTETATNQSFNKVGSGSFTRSNRYRRLPTSNASSQNSAGVRASNTRNYNSDVAKRYSMRGGYQRAGDTTSAERKARRTYRPQRISSASDTNRSGNLNTTVKWNVLSNQFTTRKAYGVNPYRLSSKYKEEQKAKRAASNTEVDVHERMMSRSRKYRGARMEGNLSGDALFLQRQAEAKSAVQQKLSE